MIAPRSTFQIALRHGIWRVTLDGAFFGDYRSKTHAIEGLDDAAAIEGVEIFHAGTKAEGGRIVANGGRVLNVTALGSTVREAQSRAYEAISRIRWPEGFYRRDIGWRAVEREKQPSEQSQGPAARLSK